MYCKNCGGPLQPDQTVCSACGAQAGIGYKFCANCGADIVPGAAVCSQCGAAANFGAGYSGTGYGGAAVGGAGYDSRAVTTGGMGYGSMGYGSNMGGTQLWCPPTKDKTAAVLLCFFLGCFGAHNFYLGETKKGLVRLIPTITGIGAILSAVLSIIDFIKMLTNSYEVNPNKYI